MQNSGLRNKMSGQSTLNIQGLTKSFAANGAAPTHALRGADLSVRSGEFLIVVGPNGSGKTTLLRVLAGELDADGGTVTLENENGNEDWLAMPRWKRASHLARVHQDPRRGTAPGMTVWENLRLACSQASLPLPWRFSPASHDRDWFASRLEKLGLSGKMDSVVSELSHGQRQLLAMELAMLRQPKFLLLDEHTASLDQANAKKCLETTEDFVRQTGLAVVMVTHNLLDALTYGDRLIIMREGQIVNNIDGEEKQALTLEPLLELCGYTM